MTGYGKAEATYGGKKIHVEVKTLNSKQLDLQVRVPSLYREHEMAVRRLCSVRIQRGKAELTIWTERDTESVNAPLNPTAIRCYAEQITALSKELGIAPPAEAMWDVLVRLPETTAAPQQETLNDEEWATVETAIKEALDRLDEFRTQEGQALEKKFEEKLQNIATLMGQIEPFEQSRVQKIRERLEERLSELRGVDYDRARLEQELIFYIEKLDISEEKQRLTNHLAYFRTTMQTGGGVGKKLGFIAQEMGREINTTGSKSNQAEMQNIVVKMKDELEQIKEQVLNVL